MCAESLRAYFERSHFVEGGNDVLAEDVGQAELQEVPPNDGAHGWLLGDEDVLVFYAPFIEEAKKKVSHLGSAGPLEDFQAGGKAALAVC